MNERPCLDKHLDSRTFRQYYYLKEELVQFCRENNLPVSGGKLEIADRIACFLDTGQVLPACGKTKAKSGTGSRTGLNAGLNIESSAVSFTLDTKIEPDFVCTEKHRAFFKEKIGKSFSFNVAFQKWLKSNPGKTYGDAILAYERILDEKKAKKTTIDRQFEYNTYIRDFFADNAGKSLDEAIRCWKYKKSQPGHNRYEQTDLKVLSKEEQVWKIRQELEQNV